MHLKSIVYRAALAACVVFAAVGPKPLMAQAQNDLTSMSLEALMNVEIIPIGIMESHIHLRGEWMFGYRFMHMATSGGDDTGSYPVRPTSMRMDMHMFMLMYGASDDVTLMAMLPYRSSTMEMETMTGMAFATYSEGVGDLMLMAHYAVSRQRSNFAIVGIGGTVPTGSIEVWGETPMGPRALAYGMQRGAGVPALIADLNWIRQGDVWNAGIHGEGRFGMGRNRRGYRPGPSWHGGAWLSYAVTEWFSPSLHADFHVQQRLVGSDASLDPATSPANDPSYGAHSEMALVPGVTFFAPGGALDGHRIIAELTIPTFHRHHSAALPAASSLTTGWQWTF